LDRCTLNEAWDVAAAVTTLFLEGTKFERGELSPDAPRRPVPALSEHPLVKHYGLPLEALALTRAHRSVEGGHRAAAWRSLLDHVTEPPRQEAVVMAMREVLARWLSYRDDVAAACGIVRDGERG
jgi:pyrroloquinoline-quinone synthase